jgi:pimeloyl-ACP methyl ester carboxylesterase
MKNTPLFRLLSFSALTTILATVIGMGCAHSPKTNAPVEAMPDPKNIVLIQGVHLDGGSWDAVKDRFDAKLFNVTTFDRVGRDTPKPGSLKDIATQSCERIVIQATLVAHSFGGAIANEMVGICPSKITKVIYVSAVVPKNREMPFKLLTGVGAKNYGKMVTFKNKKIIPKDAQTFFKYGDPVYDFKSVPVPTLYPEWKSISSAPVHYENSRFQAIPKVYLFTDQDIVMTPAIQAKYAKRLKSAATGHLATGHFPMLSDPNALYQAILTNL